MTNYSRELYGPRGVAHPGGGDDDDEDGGDEEDSKATPAINQGRGGTIDYLQFKTYRHTTHSFFLFCFYVSMFFFSYSPW